jgi:hypothetical protein
MCPVTTALLRGLQEYGLKLVSITIKHWHHSNKL